MTKQQVKLLAAAPIVLSMIVLADIGDITRKAIRDFKRMFADLGNPRLGD